MSRRRQPAGGGEGTRPDGGGEGVRPDGGGEGARPDAFRAEALLAATALSPGADRVQAQEVGVAGAWDEDQDLYSHPTKGLVG